MAAQDWAALGLDGPALARVERCARTWLDLVTGLQQSGGWALKYGLPDFTVEVWPPYQPVVDANPHCTIIANSKAYTTSHTALQFAYAWECLGEPRYLDVARATADMYLRSQSPEGWWATSIFINAEGEPFLPEQLMPWHVTRNLLIQDNAQTGPLQLLLYMSRLTGEERYLDAALRSGGLLLRAQNPNGSWSYTYNSETGTGFSYKGVEHGGELNDGATTDAMTKLLMLYQLTGERKYLDPIVRAADWLVEAQLDGPTWGWAAQYDAEDNPSWARLFEPPAVDDGNGTQAAIAGLLFAWNLTGDDRYLAPIDRCITWLKQIRDADPDGIVWNYYDPTTARPLMAENNQISYLDTDAQARAKAKGNPGYLGGPAVANGGIEAREQKLRTYRERGPLCLTEADTTPPTTEALAGRARQWQVRAEEGATALEAFYADMTGDLAVVDGRGRIYPMLDFIRYARAAAGLIPPERMLTEIYLYTRADSHVIANPNIFRTPLGAGRQADG